MKKIIYIPLLTSLTVLLIFFYPTVPHIESLRAKNRTSDLVFLDRTGALIHEYRRDYSFRRLNWLPLSEFPDTLKRLTVKTEDKRFWSHKGVDFTAALHAAFKIPRRGASTITMQVVNLIYPRMKVLRRYSVILYKILQGLSAIRLELDWSKEDILEAYLNLAPLRGELIGFPTASRVLYNKYPQALTKDEVALLIAMLPAPNQQIAKVKERACQILKAPLDCDRSEWIIQSTAVPGRRIQFAPHFARRVLEKMHQPGGSNIIRTSLLAPLQRYSQELLSATLEELSERNVQEGAILVVHNPSGAVLAYVANKGPNSKNYFVDGILASRQAGSTLKPFLYATAFEENLLTPNSLLDDTPFMQAQSSGSYTPRNYDKIFHGQVSVAQALGSSLNIPAVRTLDLIGPEIFLEKLLRLGFPVDQQAEHYGLSLALGSIEISLDSLVNGFRTLANEGKHTPLCFLDMCSPDTRVVPTAFGPPATQKVTMILQDRSVRALTFGIDSPLNLSFPAAVKTGTSRDMRDNWCVGYTETYTVGVWVGNFDNAPMWDVSGLTGAAPVWSEVMQWLHEHYPPSLESTNSFSPLQTHPPQPDKRHIRPYFIYPNRGAVLAIDDSIPEQNNKVLIQISGASPNYKVTHNGKLLGQAFPAIAWKPSRGKHYFSVIDNDANVLDSIEFSVR